MKQKDTMVIIAVVIFAGIFSLLISNVLFKTNKRDLKAETAQAISTEFKQPDKSVFNDQAINPTKLIQIGDSTNPQPF